MTDPTPVDPSQLPSVRQLTIASFAAVVVAVLLGVTTVLPAEYGIDPTGAGTALGLTQLGELKQADPHDPPAKPEPVAFTNRDDTVTLTLKPNEGAEVKAVMRAGDAIDFSWSVDVGPLFFEFHGDPKGKPASEFTSYEKATKQTSEGHFEADFEGKHGWYWKNKHAEPATITLHTKGVYQSVSRQ